MKGFAQTACIEEMLHLLFLHGATHNYFFENKFKLIFEMQQSFAGEIYTKF